METFDEGYSVKEDQVLWEIHEIRHELHEEWKNRPLTERNLSARKLFEQWAKRGSASGDGIGRETGGVSAAEKQRT